MNYQVGQSILFELTKELAEIWNAREENSILPGDVFVPAHEGESYPAVIIAIREDKVYIKVWPIGGGALNVAVPFVKE